MVVVGLCSSLTSLSFKPSLNEARREITGEGVQEKERAGNKGTSAGIIKLDIPIFNPYVSVFVYM